MGSRLALAVERERIAVLMAIPRGEVRSAAELRVAAGLDTRHMNVTLGHLRWLREHGLLESWGHVARDGGTAWTHTWPAGATAVELLASASSGGGQDA